MILILGAKVGTDQLKKMIKLFITKVDEENQIENLGCLLKVAVNM